MNEYRFAFVKKNKKKDGHLSARLDADIYK